MKQACCLSLKLFNMHIDNVITIWKRSLPSSTKLDSTASINIILFVDDQGIFQNNDDDLQREIFKLHQLCQLYNMKISVAKTKTMAFKGKVLIRTKIVLYNLTS